MQTRERDGNPAAPMLFVRGKKRQADVARRFAPVPLASVHWGTFCLSDCLLVRSLLWLLRLNAPNVANN